MPNKYRALRGVLNAALLPLIAVGVSGFAEPCGTSSTQTPVSSPTPAMDFTFSVGDWLIGEQLIC